MEKIIKDLLVKFKKLPKYQFERRIDIYIVPELESIFKKLFNEDVHFIYPEFPLQSLNLKKQMYFKDLNTKTLLSIKKRENRLNSNVDYLLASKDKFYLVELKTDIKSFKKIDQLLYYAFYDNKKFEEVFDFFKFLAENSKHKKWEMGFNYLCETYNGVIKKDIKSACHNKIQTIYFGPSKIKETKEFKKLNELVSPNKIELISFQQIADFVRNENLKELLLDIEDEYK